MATVQIIISSVLALAVLLGISMMSKVGSAVRGNLLSALAMLVGVVATLSFSGVVSAWTIYPSIIVGALIGGIMARRVQMIQMPQLVALFNGLGGGASALVGVLSALEIGFTPEQLQEINANGYMPFVLFTSMLAIAVGMITLVGSLIAAGKLHRVLSQKPVIWQGHSFFTVIFLLLTVALIAVGTFRGDIMLVVACIITSSLFGLFFSIRVGGADMPITISLLNSLSGVAGSIAGMAISDVFLVAVGGIVGASGLLLTQIMCRAMNRSLINILVPRAPKKAPATITETDYPEEENKELITRVMKLEERIKQLEAIVAKLEDRVKVLDGQIEAAPKEGAEAPSAANALAAAKRVIIVPGYGMALAQAQHKVKQLAELLESRGAEVRFAIHPVAGRMPGHMNVLLAEADVPYEKLYEMDQINDDFKNVDAVVVIGANDVLNPAARNAEGTPIYGMPVLSVDEAPEVVICNYDLNPGYAGVDNPLYTRGNGVYLELGDAKETLQRIIAEVTTK
ncbi:MAG: NAD(P)(+) transhydrogenase (Re/Si-specific) subunit beta [Prevotella sp.]|uniref:NAD(P)(+) transhydrogenase (Re/Si-specific) subunit beta n=1 Tax=Prevotella sp. TaxID=59823 RepID=UPI002A3394D0|nr:NAD(P)(+) transhydrogenase (Re/Si-specific) subunit beta [Prevotella sp.]MDD7318636.1 NAD(P)(+) transhydrogenase (Re/Si-specific) subunit beta [Prevotellaceae bacterium]MDY4019408.1 NAD(P)(+) transhydrogenase (Re/Si-specific) subunit beta [Prevotella sp.]